jgi:dolichol-phosphate mannosyltransferase
MSTNGSRTTRLISVVIPCFNEAENISAVHERVTSAISGVEANYEIVFVNNGSTDNSAEILKALSATDKHVTVLALSRNFGAQTAYSAGLDYARGDCAILMDGDLQDPPEVIPEMLDKWKEGYEVVYGKRVKRRGSVFVRATGKVFYRLFSRLSYIDIPTDVGDFSLVDRRVLDVMNAMPERNRFIRGLRAWAGFRQIGVPYVRDPRVAGKSSNSIRDLFRWASTGLVSFSYAPLEWISLLAFAVTALAVLAMAVYTTLFFIFPNEPRGTQTILVIVLFLGAIQLFCLGIIGSYLAQIFEEIKGRPKYVVDRVDNDQRSEVE